MMTGTREELERILRERLSPRRLEVLDESHLHAGHPGARGGGGHFRVTVVSEAFAGLTLLERHRLIYRLLAGSLGSSIHALALETRTPEEAGDGEGP